MSVWDVIWTAFAAIMTGGFLILEATSLLAARGRTTDTFSAKIRNALGVEPRNPRRWWLQALFVLFLLWFGIHIMTPWL